jgi:hypothetical protein
MQTMFTIVSGIDYDVRHSKCVLIEAEQAIRTEGWRAKVPEKPPRVSRHTGGRSTRPKGGYPDNDSAYVTTAVIVG